MGSLNAPTTPAQIDIWRASTSETQRLEFKAAKTQYDNESLYEYCVGIANEGGGHILFGIENKPPRPVVGSSAFNNLVAMEEKLQNNLGFRVVMEQVMHPSGRVVVCHIPSRPRGTAYNRKGAYLMRSGECLVPMSEDHLRKIFDEGKPDWLEEVALDGLSVDQVASLLHLKTFFDLRQLPFPSSDEAAIDRLVIENLVDKVDGKYAIRRIAAILLATKLGDFPDEISRKKIRVFVYNGVSKTDTKLERVGARGYAAGFAGLVRFVGEQLPQNEIIQDAVRNEVKLVPQNVIRELIANALIHQDFRIHGTSVMIEIYSDRVEITNPGIPEIPTERFIDECQSRNERLAMMMRMLRLCEEKGSGVDRVVEAAEFFQLPAPDFRTGLQSTKSVLFGPKAFDDMVREDRVRACYQHCCLRYVISQRMTNQTLRERFKLPESKSTVISQIIAATVEARLIKSDERAGGSKKFARYIPYWA